MAVPSLTPGDPAATFSALGQWKVALDAATDLLANLQQASAAAQALITAEAQTRQQAVSSEAQTRQQAVASEALTRGLADAGLSQAIVAVQQALAAGLAGERSERETVDQELTQDIQQASSIARAAIAALQQQLSGQISDLTTSVAAAHREALITALDGVRPGIASHAFAASAVGSFDALEPLDPAGSVSTAFGAAYQIVGAGMIAPRVPIIVDPDAILVLKVRYWRLTDVVDPNNNAVDVGIQWLDADDTDVGTVLVQRTRDLTVFGGPRTLTVRVPSEVDAQLLGKPVIQPPRAAVSWRPYLRTYGDGGKTAVGILGVFDATFAGVFAPDLSALAGRVGTVEGQAALLAKAADTAGRVQNKATDPTDDDVPLGTVRTFKNTTTGRLTLWANDGGTLVDLLSFTPAS